MDDELRSELKQINKKLDSINNLLTQITYSTEKVDNHINFVESVYEYVKKPLSKFLAIPSTPQITPSVYTPI